MTDLEKTETFQKQNLGGEKHMNFKLSDNQKYNMIWSLLNPRFNEENEYTMDYAVCEVYDEYAVVFKFETGAYERAYYTKDDKARIEVGTLSRFGLLEMSRQRIRASLASQSHITCQACKGTGKIRNPELIALEVLRKIQAAVILGNISLVQVRLSTAPAIFIVLRTQ